MFEEYTKSFYMDFDGQRRAEYFFERIVVLSSVIGLIVGYFYQQFSLVIILLAVGFAFSALISIPPWPMYRRCPLRWQKHNPMMFDDYSNASDDRSYPAVNEQQLSQQYAQSNRLKSSKK